MSKVPTLMAAFAIPVLLQAQAPPPKPLPLTPAQIQAFKANFHRLCEEGKVVGASVMILEGDREVLAETHGLQDATAKTPVTRATAFHWASITKTFTSVAILQARDRGLLSLDDPITKYLPELRKVHNPFGSMDAITLRQLLAHTAGFRASTWPWAKGEAWEPFEPTAWSQIVAMLPYSRIEFAPGSKYGYSNPGYIFLARVIEEVTGDPFVSYVEKNILRPLGMQETYFDRAPYHLLARRSHSYTWLTEKNAREEDPFDFHTGITTGNGGLNAPLVDMAKWVRFIAGGPKAVHAGSSDIPVLSEKSRSELMDPVILSKSFTENDWRTLGFWRTAHKGTEWVTHTGGQNGFSSRIALDPLTGRAMIQAFNTKDDWPGGKKRPEGRVPTPPFREVFQAYLDMVSGQSAASAKPKEP